MPVGAYLLAVRATEVAKRIVDLGGRKLRQKGSHARFVCACGRHHTTVPMHTGDVPMGTLRGIEKDLACLGEGWLRR